MRNADATCERTKEMVGASSTNASHRGVHGTWGEVTALGRRGARSFNVSAKRRKHGRSQASILGTEIAERTLKGASPAVRRITSVFSR